MTAHRNYFVAQLAAGAQRYITAGVGRFVPVRFE
jgi:hypothetical protein